MAAPKKKATKSQSRTRFSAFCKKKNEKFNNLAKHNLNKCNQCFNVKLSHFICKFCLQNKLLKLKK